MAPKFLISKMEKLGLDGGGVGKPGTKTKVCHFCSFSGLQPVPLILPLLFSPKSQERLGACIVRSPKAHEQEDGRGRLGLPMDGMCGCYAWAWKRRDQER